MLLTIDQNYLTIHPFRPSSPDVYLFVTFLDHPSPSRGILSNVTFISFPDYWRYGVHLNLAAAV